MGNTRLTHLRHDGTAQMVDVSNKAQSTREATATATVRSTAEVLALLGGGELPEGRRPGRRPHRRDHGGQEDRRT